MEISMDSLIYAEVLKFANFEFHLSLCPDPDVI